ncbi:MAG: metallophosphoesterase family protein [Planctomycetota bacterium]
MDERIAVLSDVHGNYEAFRAVLASLQEKGIQKICYLGDIVGYGACGAMCLRLLRQLGIPSVQGNHDGNIRPPRDPEMRPVTQHILDRELMALTTEEVEYLLNLPIREEVEGNLMLVHGAITGRDDYILSPLAAEVNQRVLREHFPETRICFFGHTHVPMVIQGHEVDRSFQETRTFALDSPEPYFINPGAVGQPRDKCPLASYGVYDPAAQTMTIERLPYNIEAEQERMRQAGFDNSTIHRLSIGF